MTFSRVLSDAIRDFYPNSEYFLDTWLVHQVTSL